MAERQRKEETQIEESPAKSKREYADPEKSDRKGMGGFLETVLRRFKNLTHLTLIVPVFVLGFLTLGTAIAAGLAVYDLVSGWGHDLPVVLRYILNGSGAAAGYFAYGFTLLFVVPLVNFVMRLNLKPWRGPYYSLEAIRWYLHNGASYLARFTFLEFVTPTPFSLLYYKMMGMKVGKGAMINTTWISDPSLIELGEKVTLGGSVTIVGHYGQGGYLVLAPVKIGNKVTIGLKAVIMGGVTIGDGAKILPNSAVLPKTVIPAGETWGGVPARKIET